MTWLHYGSAAFKGEEVLFRTGTGGKARPPSAGSETGPAPQILRRCAPQDDTVGCRRSGPWRAGLRPAPTGGVRLQAIGHELSLRRSIIWSRGKRGRFQTCPYGVRVGLGLGKLAGLSASLAHREGLCWMYWRTALSSLSLRMTRS